MNGADYRRLAAAQMSEKALDSNIRRLLHALGLAPTSFHPPDGTGRYRAGFPDWVIVGPGGILYRELKSQKGRLSAEQRVWLEALRTAGADADVWRPEDWMSGRIQRELTALAGRAARVA